MQPSKPTHVVSCPMSKTETFRTEMDDWTLLDASIHHSQFKDWTHYIINSAYVTKLDKRQN